MRTGHCRCGNRIFFSNQTCLGCRAVLGRCNECKSLTSFSTQDGTTTCDACHAEVHACVNQQHDVCNVFNAESDALCRWCQFTTVTPNLRNAENRLRWSRLEAAKRRLLMELDNLGLPPFVGDLQQSHPLRFQFLADSTDAKNDPVNVITGHDAGLITININEADSVQREKLRVQLGEPQRTLIGHMRHEVGHYIDWSLASRAAADEYYRLFGDPDSIDYQQAMDKHYSNGPKRNWANEHVSAYATMHPWEDFAETVNAYLDIMAIATTANDQGLGQLDLSSTADASKLVHEVLEIVVLVSEFNFDLGLLPLFPERLPPPVIEKIAFVHGLRQRTRKLVETH